MVFKNLCVLALWTNIASVLEGLTCQKILSMFPKLVELPFAIQYLAFYDFLLLRQGTTRAMRALVVACLWLWLWLWQDCGGSDGGDRGGGGGFEGNGIVSHVGRRQSGAEL